MAPSAFHTLLIRVSSWKVLFVFFLILGFTLAAIEVFNTWVLFSNYDNPPPLVPYPAFISYMSFGLAIPLIHKVRNLSSTLNSAKPWAFHIVAGLLFVTAHIYVSNLSDWYFFERDWTIAGSFQFVFTVRFLYELLIYLGITGVMYSLQNVELKYRDEHTSIYPTSIEVKKSGKVMYVKIQDISWIEANDNYINIYSNGRPHILRKKLKEIKQDLDPSVFQQIHRSSIVNIKAVKELETHADGGCMVHLKNGTTLKATKTYRKSLKAKLAAAD